MDSVVDIVVLSVVAFLARTVRVVPQQQMDVASPPAEAVGVRAH